MFEGSFDMTHCLIVDHCETERARVQDMLSAYKFDVDVAAGADEALAKCRGVMPDMIVMSESLGGMDAFDFIKRVRRARCGREPVVLVYADQAEAGHIGRAIWEGASECLVKPFDADVLEGKLKQVGVL
jgi:two-component system chemotaxis response regulator CheY